jgi:hypothetical protein
MHLHVCAQLRQKVIVVAFLVSFLIFFNFLIFPTNPDSPRITDVMAVALCVCFIFYIILRDRLTETFLWLYGAFLLAIIPAVILALGQDDFSRFVLSARWLVYIPAGFVAANYVIERQAIWSCLLGTLAGTFANLVILFLQSQGFGFELVAAGLAPVDAATVSVFARERYTGMWGHPNVVSAVVSFCTPVCIYLYIVFRWKAVALITGLSTLALCFIFTETRSPLLLSVVLIFIAILVYEPLFKVIGTIIFIPILGAVTVMLAVPQQLDRWLDFRLASDNAVGRGDTIITAMAKIIAEPLGHNLEVFRDAWLLLFPGTGVHNGFLFFGVVFGLPAFFLLLFFTFRALKHLARNQSHMSIFFFLMLLHISLLMLTEDHTLNPTFIMLWSVTATAICIRAIHVAEDEAVLVENDETPHDEETQSTSPATQ